MLRGDISVNGNCTSILESVIHEFADEEWWAPTSPDEGSKKADAK